MDKQITTTLYDLICALQDETANEPDSDRLIVAAVKHLIKTKQLRFLVRHKDIVPTFSI